MRHLLKMSPDDESVREVRAPPKANHDGSRPWTGDRNMSPMAEASMAPVWFISLWSLMLYLERSAATSMCTLFALYISGNMKHMPTTRNGIVMTTPRPTFVIKLMTSTPSSSRPFAMMMLGGLVIVVIVDPMVLMIVSMMT